MALLDVNVLSALVWESHVHHPAARRWFAARRDPWSTCAVTQAGFVRLSANPTVFEDALAVAEARAVLAALVTRDDHRFLPDALDFVGNVLVPHDRLVGHRQVTDAHLVAIARQHGTTVATFDSALRALAPEAVTVVPAAVTRQ